MLRVEQVPVERVIQLRRLGLLQRLLRGAPSAVLAMLGEAVLVAGTWAHVPCSDLLWLSERVSAPGAPRRCGPPR
eukprot:9388795-Pyramimonas_sp.AAC.1